MHKVQVPRPVPSLHRTAVHAPCLAEVAMRHVRPLLVAVLIPLSVAVTIAFRILVTQPPVAALPLTLPWRIRGERAQGGMPRG